MPPADEYPPDPKPRGKYPISWSSRQRLQVQAPVQIQSRVWRLRETRNLSFRKDENCSSSASQSVRSNNQFDQLMNPASRAEFEPARTGTLYPFAYRSMCRGVHNISLRFFSSASRFK